MIRRFLSALPALGLAACAGLAPPPPPAAPATLPAQWLAPLPHGGELQGLQQWWQRFDDPLVPALVAQAQAQGPTLAQALARIEQARAALRSSGAARLPTLDANGRIARSSSALPPFAGIATQGTASLDARWELDLFGALRQAERAAGERLAGSELAWHDARVSLAAETAQAYANLRSCEAVLSVLQLQAESQQRAAGLTNEKLRVGFEAPAAAALADAAAADSASRARAQAADCGVAVAALATLVGEPADTLAPRLAERRGRLPQPAAFAVNAVPAALLAQRPDLRAAQRQLAAAAADIAVADAQRYPALALTGSVGWQLLKFGGNTLDGSTWSIAPALLAPLFDGGRRAAAVDNARGRYDEARAGFEQQARQAVREVEEALLRLDAAASREADAGRAAEGYRRHFEAAEARWRAGAGSVLEMEDARRLQLNAQSALLGVQRERVLAWLALYRASGGGWDAGATTNDKTAEVTR